MVECGIIMQLALAVISIIIIIIKIITIIKMLNINKNNIDISKNKK